MSFTLHSNQLYLRNHYHLFVLTHLPVRIHVPSFTSDVTSLLTCAEWRDLSNHNRMSTIQSRTPEKKAKHHVTLTLKFPWKSCPTTHLPSLSSNPKILKAFLKTFPIKMKPTKCPAREKKWGKKSEKRGEERKQKVKVKTAVSKHVFKQNLQGRMG